MKRPGWDKYYILIAEQVAERSTCPVRQVGAVFVNPNTKSILTVGYNGAPRGTQHCGEACATRSHGKNQELCRAVHAEVNAIYNAALNGVGLDGCVVYSTLSPCLTCARAIIQVGAKEVYYQYASAYPDAIYLLGEAGIPAYPVALYE